MSNVSQRYIKRLTNKLYTIKLGFVKGELVITEEKSFRTYTPEQVAEIFQVSPKTIKQYIRQGKLKAAAFGNRIRVSEEHVREFYSNHLVNTDDDIDLDGDEIKQEQED